MRARIIDNPYSFRGPYPVARVLPTFAAAGWEVDVVHRLPGLAGGRLISEAAAAGVELVIAAGGDGTLRDLASAIADTPLALGILPGGTANVVARELSIPLRPEWAARLLVNGRTRYLDLGRLGLEDGRWARFVLACGLGLDAAGLRATDAGLKRRVGPLAICLGLVRAVPDLRRFEARLCVDGAPAWEGRAWQVLASNTARYAVWLRPSPAALLDDGLLDLCLVTASGPRAAARTLGSFAVRGRPDASGARWFQGRAFELELDGLVPGQLDGSPLAPLLAGRVRLTVEPGALAVRLPDL
ncbi:MAG: hypothetical protein EPN50_04190 [Chloroflexota bacterium]|nr:MAG: hypothetical protein EPN50_04190 [Chloroflexota bacterium]